MTHREIQKLTDIQLRIFDHLISLYDSVDEGFKFYRTVFLQRSGIKISPNALSKHLKRLDELGYIDKETIIVKPTRLPNGKLVPIKSFTYIKICKASQCAMGAKYNVQRLNNEEQVGTRSTPRKKASVGSQRQQKEECQLINGHRVYEPWI